MPPSGNTFNKAGEGFGETHHTEGDTVALTIDKARLNALKAMTMQMQTIAGTTLQVSGRQRVEGKFNHNRGREIGAKEVALTPDGRQVTGIIREDLEKEGKAFDVVAYGKRLNGKTEKTSSHHRVIVKE